MTGSGQESATLDSALIRAMVESAVDGIIVINERGIVEAINPAAERLFDYSADQVIGRNVKMLMPEPYCSEHDGYLDNYVRTGTRKIIGIGREVTGQRKDGSTFPMYLSVGEARFGERRLFTGIVHDLTQHKRAEEQIAGLQRRQELILDAVGEGILGLDAAGRVSFANRAAGAMLSWPEDELIGRPLCELWPEPYCEGAHGDRVLGSLGVCRGEDGVFQRRDGSRFPAEYSSTPIRELERVVGAVISFQNITQRHEAQEALIRERDSAQNYLDVAGVMLVALDREGRITLVNKKGCCILGYEEQELLGKNWFESIIPENERETIRATFRGLIGGAGEYLEDYENSVMTRDGSQRLIAWHNTRLRNAEGELCGTLSSGEDITERKAAAREMQRMRSYLKNIIDSMPSILVGVDAEHRVTEWNLGAEKATGVPHDAALGRSFTEVLPQLESQLDRVREAIRKRAPVRNERVLSEEAGETRYADVVVYPLVANGVVGAVIRVDDITNRVRIEQMMVQTEKMMSVGGLAAGMAHEINNPLSAVMQGSQNILRRLSPALPANRSAAEALNVDLNKVHGYLEERGVLRFLEGIRDAGARATRIVADMLAFSRRGNAESTPIRVDDMLDTVIRLAASDYDLKKEYDFLQIEIVRDYDPTLSEIYCDRTEIEQVVLNLVKNAAQAMTGAGMSPHHCITLRTRREGDVARIEVQDNGPGMDEATRSRVFEPFFTTKAVGVGTGLGLSVSYFIVTEQHQGSISVTSTPGQGACFIIRLPLRGRKAS